MSEMIYMPKFGVAFDKLLIFLINYSPVLVTSDRSHPALLPRLFYTQKMLSEGQFFKN